MPLFSKRYAHYRPARIRSLASGSRRFKCAARQSLTFATYKFQSRHVVGPLAPSEARRAIIRSGVGARAKACDIELLGRVKVQDLTTRQIRAWHKLLSEEVSVYSANRALMILKAALSLAAEDHEF
jgi:integrase